MPELFDDVFTGRSRDFVVNENDMRLAKLNAPEMCKSGEATLSLQQIAIGVGFPIKKFGLWRLCPAERAGCGGLVQAVHSDCVVGAGSTKPIAPAGTT